VLVALVLDVSEPDLTPVENLLTPTMLDVLVQAAAAADQPDLHRSSFPVPGPGTRTRDLGRVRSALGARM
jgi:D-alanyl-D-alanine carboxypeptidase